MLPSVKGFSAYFREVQGQTPVAVPFSRQALNTFDAQSRKNEGGSGNGRNQMQNNPMMMNNQNMNMRGGMGMGPRDMGMGMGMQQRPNDQRPRMPPRLPGMPFPGMPRLPMGMGMPGGRVWLRKNREQHDLEFLLLFFVSNFKKSRWPKAVVRKIDHFPFWNLWTVDFGPHFAGPCDCPSVAGS